MTIVQYILVRGDLLLREGWPVGAVLAQACHAATAAIHLFYRQWSSSTITTSNRRSPINLSLDFMFPTGDD